MMAENASYNAISFIGLVHVGRFEFDSIHIG